MTKRNRAYNQQNRLGRKYLLRTGILGVFFITFIIFSFFYMVETVNNNNQLRKNITELDGNLTDLYISVINQETGQRGFHLTKNKEFLEPFDQGIIAFKVNQEKLHKLVMEYPQFREVIFETIEKGAHWTEYYGAPQIQMIKNGEAPSEISLENGKEAFDTFRKSYQKTHTFVDNMRMDMETDFKRKLIFMFSFTSILSIIIFIIVWTRMYIEFKMLINPIIKLSQCVKEYAHNIFTRETPLYNEKNELGDLISHTETMRVELEKNRRYLEKSAYTDALTGVFNRRYLDLMLQNEWSKQLGTEKLSVIMFDIDYFKKFNDFYGHVAGDECLKRVAIAMQEQFQDSNDVPTRYGGEEFVILVFGQEEMDVVYKAEGLRKAVENLKIPHEGSEVSRYVTISVGVATIEQNSHIDIQAFIHLADEALYQSKLNGRNQVNSSAIQ